MKMANNQCKECGCACTKCLATDHDVHLHVEIENLKQRLVERDNHIVTMETNFLNEANKYPNGELVALREELVTWQDKYKRLYEAHRRVQRVNQGLEDKLLRLVDVSETDKNTLTKDVATLSHKLAEANYTIKKLTEDNERYKNDVSLAIQFLQCKPTNFVSQKFDTLPNEVQAKVSTYMANKRKPEERKSPPEVKSIKVPIPTFPPTAMVYSIPKTQTQSNQPEEKELDSQSVDIVSAAIMAKVLEERERERSCVKHCDTCACAKGIKIIHHNIGFHSVGTQTNDNGGNSLCLNCNSNLESLSQVVKIVKNVENNVKNKIVPVYIHDYNEPSVANQNVAKVQPYNFLIDGGKSKINDCSFKNNSTIQRTVKNDSERGKRNERGLIIRGEINQSVKSDRENSVNDNRIRGIVTCNEQVVETIGEKTNKNILNSNNIRSGEKTNDKLLRNDSICMKGRTINDNLCMKGRTFKNDFSSNVNRTEFEEQIDLNEKANVSQNHLQFTQIPTNEPLLNEKHPITTHLHSTQIPIFDTSRQILSNVNQVKNHLNSTQTMSNVLQKSIRSCDKQMNATKKQLIFTQIPSNDSENQIQLCEKQVNKSQPHLPSSQIPINESQNQIISSTNQIKFPSTKSESPKLIHEPLLSEDRRLNYNTSIESRAQFQLNDSQGQFHLSESRAKTHSSTSQTHESQSQFCFRESQPQMRLNDSQFPLGYSQRQCVINKSQLFQNSNEELQKNTKINASHNHFLSGEQLIDKQIKHDKQLKQLQLNDTQSNQTELIPALNDGQLKHIQLHPHLCDKQLTQFQLNAYNSEKQLSYSQIQLSQLSELQHKQQQCHISRKQQELYHFSENQLKMFEAHPHLRHEKLKVQPLRSDVQFHSSDFSSPSQSHIGVVSLVGQHVSDEDALSQNCLHQSSTTHYLNDQHKSHSHMHIRKSQTSDYLNETIHHHLSERARHLSVQPLHMETANNMNETASYQNENASYLNITPKHLNETQTYSSKTHTPMHLSETEQFSSEISKRTSEIQRCSSETPTDFSRLVKHSEENPSKINSVVNTDESHITHLSDKEVDISQANSLSSADEGFKTQSSVSEEQMLNDSNKKESQGNKHLTSVDKKQINKSRRFGRTPVSSVSQICHYLIDDQGNASEIYTYTTEGKNSEIKEDSKVTKVKLQNSHQNQTMNSNVKQESKSKLSFNNALSDNKTNKIENEKPVMKFNYNEHQAIVMNLIENQKKESHLSSNSSEYCTSDDEEDLDKQDELHTIKVSTTVDLMQTDKKRLRSNQVHLNDDEEFEFPTRAEKSSLSHKTENFEQCNLTNQDSLNKNTIKNDFSRVQNLHDNHCYVNDKPAHLSHIKDGYLYENISCKQSPKSESCLMLHDKESLTHFIENAAQPIKSSLNMKIGDNHGNVSENRTYKLQQDVSDCFNANNGHLSKTQVHLSDSNMDLNVIHDNLSLCQNTEINQSQTDLTEEFSENLLRDETESGKDSNKLSCSFNDHNFFEQLKPELAEPYKGGRHCSMRLQSGSKNVVLENFPPILYTKTNEKISNRSSSKITKPESISSSDSKNSKTISSISENTSNQRVAEWIQSNSTDQHYSDHSESSSSLKTDDICVVRIDKEKYKEMENNVKKFLFGEYNFLKTVEIGKHKYDNACKDETEN